MEDCVEKLVQSTVADFKRHLENTKSLYSELVARLTSEVEAVGMDAIDDYFMDAIDETRGHIASKVSNRIEEPAAREAAISQVEDWFSQNISDQGAEIAVVCAIWGYGPVQAPADIRKEIASVQRSVALPTPGM